MSYIATIKLALVIVALLAAGGGYWYVTNLQANLVTSEANNVILKTANATQKVTIMKMVTDITDVKIINAELSQVVETQDKEIKELHDKFNVRANGTSRDFGAITRVKPGLIKKIVNRATKNVNRCFELATGAPILPGEKNNECKELIRTLSSSTE
jgi:hypothetical protein